MAAVQNITKHQPTKNMCPHSIMVLRSGTSGVGCREGCYASFWRQLRGNILEKNKIICWVYKLLFFLRQFTYLTKNLWQRPRPTHHENGTPRILALNNSHAAGSGKWLHHGCEGFRRLTSFFFKYYHFHVQIEWYHRIVSFLRCQVQK